MEHMMYAGYTETVMILAASGSRLAERECMEVGRGKRGTSDSDSSRMVVVHG